MNLVVRKEFCFVQVQLLVYILFMTCVCILWRFLCEHYNVWRSLSLFFPFSLCFTVMPSPAILCTRLVGNGVAMHYYLAFGRE